MYNTIEKEKKDLNNNLSEKISPLRAQYIRDPKNRYGGKFFQDKATWSFIIRFGDP